MPDSSLGPPGVGELSRQVREVLARFEQLVNKLETQFVTKDFFTLYTGGVTREIEHLADGAKNAEKTEKDRNDVLEKRIANLENNQRWVVRIVLAAVIVALLGIIGFGKSGGS